jgi:hypothetical protein
MKTKGHARPARTVTFLPAPVEDFFVNRLNIDWTSQHALDPEKHGAPVLYQIWNERPALMVRATELFPNFTHFIWLDIGIFRSKIKTPLRFATQTLRRCDFPEVVMLEVSPFTAEDLVIENELPTFALRLGQLPDRIAGGEFWGTPTALRSMARGYYALMIALANRNIFIGKDQIVYNSLFALNQSLIRLLPPDNKGDPWWTFPRILSSVEEFSACTLVPNDA